MADEQVKYTPEDLVEAQRFSGHKGVHYGCGHCIENERIATLIAQVRRDTFDQFWDYIAAHYGVPAGRYTPAELVDALAESVRREERQKATAILESIAQSPEYAEALASEALADLRKGHANET